MKTVHQNLMISNSVFTAFNEELLSVMTAAGVTREDTNNVNDLLVCSYSFFFDYYY
jgi:hypothetical protein